MTDKFSKLPVVAKPINYDLHLKPCLKTFKCPGTTSIDLQVLEKTDYFKLHARELDIKSASLQLADGKVYNNLAINMDNKWNLLTVNLPLTLEPNTNVKLNFDYTAELNTMMQGFSRSIYKDAAGNEKFMASTQFESTYARQSFPCWDEPTYKATFNVALEVAKNLTALSNMNVVNELKVDGDHKLVKFAQTPIMSTYLVAFAVGEFEYIEAKSKSGVVMRIYTVEGKKHLVQYALDVAVKFMDYHEEWFDIKYPLPKCDLIAIPDFSMGAMENWGLVTFREICLLHDPKQTSTLVKAHIALVVAHELAHFWFGNLVTMKWWQDLWLKEGFASFTEYLATAKICPEFNIMLHFINDEVNRAFALDGLRSSHPIEVKIDNPNELDEIYDSIMYSKSNSIIRMLYSHLGEPTFQKGLRIYLKRHQYDNAETTDLWKALSEASGQDIDGLMSSWTKQMGYPIVTVQQQIGGERRTLKLHQQRFLVDGGVDEAQPRWQIPISVISASSPSAPIHKSIFNDTDGEIVLEGVKPSDWIKVNTDLTGFYRVHYTGDMLEALLPAVQSKALGVSDRFSIVDDLWALVRSQKASAKQFLQLIQACADEDQYIVWSAIAQGLTSISTMIEYMEDGAELKPFFDGFICNLLEPVWNRLGWEPAEDEDSHIGVLRSLVLGLLLKSDHAVSVQTALSKFDEHVSKKAELVADLRRCIYATAARTNKKEAIDALKTIVETAGLSEVEVQSASAMSQATDSNVLANVFKYCIDDNKIRSQDFPRFFAGACLSRPGREFIWTYFKNNAQKLVQTFGSVNSTMFQRILVFVVEGNFSKAFADEAEAFFKSEFDEHSQSVFNRPLSQALERVRINEKLLKANEEDVREFFGGRN